MGKIFKILLFFIGLNSILFSCTTQDLDEENIMLNPDIQDVNPPGDPSN